MTSAHSRYHAPGEVTKRAGYVHAVHPERLLLLRPSFGFSFFALLMCLLLLLVSYSLPRSGPTLSHGCKLATPYLSNGTGVRSISPRGTLSHASKNISTPYVPPHIIYEVFHLSKLSFWSSSCICQNNVGYGVITITYHPPQKAQLAAIDLHIITGIGFFED